MTVTVRAAGRVPASGANLNRDLARGPGLGSLAMQVSILPARAGEVLWNIAAIPHIPGCHTRYPSHYLVGIAVRVFRVRLTIAISISEAFFVCFINQRQDLELHHEKM